MNNFWFRALLIAACLGSLAIPPTLSHPEIQHGWVTAAIILVSVGLSVAAGSLLTPDPPSIAKDDRPQPPATRGQYIPLVIGREMVEPFFAWIQPEDSAITEGGDLVDNSGNSLIGKGFGGQAPAGQEFEEAALHILCVGPGAVLHRITNNGETVWEGGITPASHPSGSSIFAGDEGIFEIYWGFEDDPPLSLLGSASNHGAIPNETSFETRYPLTMKVLWNKKKLGSTRQFPRLRYEVEVAAKSNNVSKVPAAMVSRALHGLPVFPPGDPLEGQIPSMFVGHIAPLYESPALPDPDVAIITPVEPGSYLAASNTLFEVYASSRANTFGGGGGGGSPAPGSGSDDWVRFYKPGTVVAFLGTGTGATPAAPSTACDIGTLGGNPVTGDVVYAWIVSAEFQERTGGPDLNVYQLETGGGGGPSFQTLYESTSVVKLTCMLGPLQGIDIVGSPPVVGSLDPTRLYMLPLSTEGSDGVNPACVLDQLMFSPSPWGAGQDTEDYDLDSLEDVGLQVGIAANLEERISINMSITEGEDAQAVVSQIAQDLGLAIPWDPVSGRYVFKLVRDEGPAAPVIEEGLIRRPLPEITSIHGPMPTNKVIFSYRDRELNYREQTLNIDNDAEQGRGTGSQQVETINLPSVTDPRSARNIGERRQLEQFVEPTTVKMRLGFNALDLTPGQRVSIPSLELGVDLRVVSLKRERLSSEVEVEFAIDHYGVESPGVPFGLPEEDDSSPSRWSLDFAEEGDPFLSPTGGGKGGTPVPPEPLARLGVFELPRTLSDGQKIQYVFAPVRESTRSTAFRIFGSRSQELYTLLAEGTEFWAGGDTQAPLSATGAFSDVFPVNPVGPDMGRIEDLSDPADVERWMAGRQVAILTDGTDFEICYVQKAQLADASYELTVMRGRDGTERRDWPLGTQVYVTKHFEVERVTSELFQMGLNLHVRSMTLRGKAASSMEASPLVSTVTAGRSILPEPVSNLRSGSSGADFDPAGETFTWSYAPVDLPMAGAGQQIFGTPVEPASPVGQFRVRVTGGREVMIDSNTWLYTQAMQVEDFGVPPVSIEITVEHVIGSFSSAPVSRTFNLKT